MDQIFQMHARLPEGHVAPARWRLLSDKRRRGTGSESSGRPWGRGPSPRRAACPGDRVVDTRARGHRRAPDAQKRRAAAGGLLGGPVGLVDGAILAGSIGGALA